MHTVKRLLTEFIPEHYTIHLTIDRPKRVFNGTVTVIGATVNNKIMLHAHELTIKTVTVDGKAAAWQLGKDDELVIADVSPGKHTIAITYTGTINDQLHGLYPCKYEHNGEQKELLATQFESHYAREVLPCVDEPAAKANFDLTVTTESGVTVLSNMPQKQDKDGRMKSNKGQQTVTFETTPKMSTYLLAFVIGDLQKKSGKTNSGVAVNVYATPAQPAKSLDFALQHSIDTIEFFDSYFGVPYPLPKSDAVALPDFSNGAMENWGLITYRENALLYDPTTTSIATKQYIATVISHELSHQWFGNLVTMAWWDDLWLNESFATIMEYICVDALHPEWNVWLDFNTNESVYALGRDSLTGVQPVKVAVHHPDEIQSVFDGAIVYAKGARLMQMMQRYVGEQAFKAGLKSYFKKHAYGNTTGQDLWDALETSSGKSVGEFMNTWLTQSGFPVLHATLTGSNVQLSQKQFVMGPHQPNSKLWPIPLGSTQSTLPPLFNKKSATFAIDTHRPLRLNAHDTAHYITHYGDTLFAKILNQIKNGESDEITRAQVIKEQSLLAKSSEVGSDTLIDLLLCYTTETNEKVWGMVSGALASLALFVDRDSPAERALRQLSGTLAAPLYNKLGWHTKPHESPDDIMLRATIVSNMLYAQDAGAIAKAREQYATQSLDEMDPELRGVILATEVRHGDTQKALDTLLMAYKSTASVDIKNDICDAVCSVKNSADIERIVALLKDTSFIRTQDTAMWYVRLLSNRYARDHAWQWLRNNWPWVHTTFGADKSYDAFPRYTAQILASRAQLTEYKAFFEPMLSDTGLRRAISVGINDITARVALVESDKMAVEQRLLQS